MKAEVKVIETQDIIVERRGSESTTDESERIAKENGGSTNEHNVSCRLKNSKLLLFTFFIAIALTAWSFYFGCISRYTSVFSTSPVLPPHDNMGVLIMQVSTSLSVFAVRQLFILSCDNLRWSVAATPGGINFVDFRVLSDSSRLTILLEMLWALVRRRGPQIRRTLTQVVSRILILYLILFAAPFIWLFQLEPTTAYRLDGQLQVLPAIPGDSIGVGTFRFIQRHPLPYSRLDSWSYLTDPTRVLEVDPVICNPSYKNCAAFSLTGYSNLSVVTSDIENTDDQSAVVLFQVPNFHVEFFSRNLTSNLDEFTGLGAYCRNITTTTDSFLKICLKGESGFDNGTDYHFKAGLEFCLDSRNCTPIMRTTPDGNEAYNNTIFVTDLSVSIANSTFILDMNGTILNAIPSVDRNNVFINISEFFEAFTSTLDYFVVNNTRLLWTDWLATPADVDNFYPVFSDPPDPYASEIIAEDYVNSLVYAFTSPQPNQNPRDHLRGFLAYALASNSGFYYGEVQRESARLTYILKISNTSLSLYLGLNCSVILSCLFFLARYWRYFGLAPSLGPLAESAMLHDAINEPREELIPLDMNDTGALHDLQIGWEWNREFRVFRRNLPNAAEAG